MDKESPVTVPLKRHLSDDGRSAATSSPVNAQSTTRMREERSKKPTAKARGEDSEVSRKTNTEANSHGSGSSAGKKSANTPVGAGAQSTGVNGGNAGTSGKKTGAKDSNTGNVLRPTRYKLPLPSARDFESTPAPVFIPVSSVRAGKQFYEASEIIANRKGFRYTNAVADPRFVSLQYNRTSEAAPYRARISFEDASAQLHFGGPHYDAVTTDKGFRMARANVGVREGRWYWECRIVSGIQRPDKHSEEETRDSIQNPSGPGHIRRNSLSNSDNTQSSGGHVRIGWARREASLESPVGFDAYSYGLRDVRGQKVTRSRPVDFANADFCEGDVLGCEIALPSINLHRKITDGIYNKAVDGTDIADEGGLGDPVHASGSPNIIRDRVVCRYRNRLYFEAYEYQISKALEEYMHPATEKSHSSAPELSDPPHPNHLAPPLRTLPSSYIKVYKNGELLGEPFRDLLAFLPPASKVSQPGAREGLDDGALGYYPAVSVFRGGAVETNFGPHFAYPPAELMSKTGDDDVVMMDTTDNCTNDEAYGQSDAERMPPPPPHAASGLAQNTSPSSTLIPLHRRLRPMCDRFDEQIAEDIVYDLIDEVDFWLLDGGDSRAAMRDLTESMPTALNPHAGESSAPIEMAGRKPLQQT